MNDCQGYRCNQQFQDVDSPKNDELVDYVQNCGEKENLSDVLPSLLQHFVAVGRVPENCPKEGRPILICIPQPGTNREMSFMPYLFRIATSSRMPPGRRTGGEYFTPSPFACGRKV